jgi:hypothetical protein
MEVFAMANRSTLSRRTVIAGLLAAPTAAIPATLEAAASDNLDMMRWLEDQHDELLAEANRIDCEMTSILENRRQLKTGMLRWSDIFSREELETRYPALEPSAKLDGSPGRATIDRYFHSKLLQAEVRARASEMDRHLPDIVRADWHRAQERMQEQIDRDDLYFEATGYEALEEQSNALFREIWTIEEKVWEMPCRSTRDISFKLEALERWMPDPAGSGGNDCYLRMILNSMRNFVEPNCRPFGNRRQSPVS